MLSLGCERLPTPLKKKKKRFWIITCTTIWVCYHYYGVFFAHLLILQYPDHHQNLISSSLYYSRPVHKISSQSVHNFLSNAVHRETNRQTDRQTNQRYQKHNLLCQGGKNWVRWNTLRAQTSAEAGSCSCFNPSDDEWTSPKASGSVPATRSRHATIIT